MKGYKLSTDYEQLWELVQDGYRVAGFGTVDICWFPGRANYLFEIEKSGVINSLYSTGSYESHHKFKATFIKTCQDIQLQYIQPIIQ